MAGDNIEKIRHSLAHIMASAILEIYPKTKLGMGPAIDNGFYYDFQLQKPLEEKDLEEIEKKMKTLIVQKLKFENKINYNVVNRGVFTLSIFNFDSIPFRLACNELRLQFTTICAP